MNTQLIDSVETARILKIDLLAVGQAVFDDKLHLVNGFMFNRSEVLKLSNNHSYLQTLR